MPQHLGHLHQQKGLAMPNFAKKTSFRLESQRPIGLYEQPAAVSTPSCFLVTSFWRA